MAARGEAGRTAGPAQHSAGWRAEQLSTWKVSLRPSRRTGGAPSGVAAAPGHLPTAIPTRPRLSPTRVACTRRASRVILSLGRRRRRYRGTALRRGSCPAAPCKKPEASTRRLHAARRHTNRSRREARAAARAWPPPRPPRRHHRRRRIARRRHRHRDLAPKREPPHRGPPHPPHCTPSRPSHLPERDPRLPPPARSPPQAALPCAGGRQTRGAEPLRRCRRQGGKQAT
mmetsp:Transcript_2830/g.7095  ORF Transcript_2830/g.7095 Transcript_2830/m.7095 type:complete len:229 (-) Transcript_2830:977-1663(-)